jgi:hypothetical protein
MTDEERKIAATVLDRAIEMRNEHEKYLAKLGAHYTWGGGDEA